MIWAGDATPVPSLPAALNGIIAKPGETQTYQFSARKNEAWQVRVYGRTLGAPIDPKIWIRAAGAPQHLLEADDSRMQDLGYVSRRGNWRIKDQMDPIAIFGVHADADYLIGIEDTTGAAGPDHVYRVEIEPARDCIYTHITTGGLSASAARRVDCAARQPLDAGRMACGGAGQHLQRRDRSGSARPAPRRYHDRAALPQGRHAHARPVCGVGGCRAAGRAHRTAGPAGGSGGQNRNGVTAGLRPRWTLLAGPRHFVFLDKYALAVTDPAPFHIELVQPGNPLGQGGELLLKAKVRRAGDFKGPLEMQTDWLPPGVSKESTVTIPPGQDEAAFRIQADDKAAPGVYKIAMNASTTGGDAYSGVGRIRVSSAFVELTIAQPYFSIDLQRAAVERGKRSEIVGMPHQNRPFPGKASVKLLQMPRGVKMLEPAPEITAQGRTGGISHRSRPRRSGTAVQGNFVRGGVPRSGPDHPAAHRLGDPARGRAARAKSRDRGISRLSGLVCRLQGCLCSAPPGTPR